MILIYIIGALLAFGLRRIFFNYIGFEYKVYEEGFKLKKFLIDFVAFFIFYLISLYIIGFFL